MEKRKTITEQVLQLMLSQESVHRNEFLRQYLYSFRNRLSELSLKHGVRYVYSSSRCCYSLANRTKAKEVLDKLFPKK